MTELKSEKRISLDYTNCLKGVLVLLVVIHHFFIKLDIPWSAYGKVATAFGTLLTVTLGYVSVALFLFISGYGLMASYRKKGIDYVDGMLKKRIAPFYIISVVSVIIYTLYELFLSKETKITGPLILQSITWGNETVVINGWYLQAQLLMYVIFFLIYGLKINDKLKLSVSFISIAVLYVTCAVLGFREYVFMSFPAFLLGLAFGQYEDGVRAVLRKGKRKIRLIELSVILLATAVSWVLSVVGGRFYYLFMTTTEIFALALFVIAHEYIGERFIVNRVTRFLGERSLEIYVFHGLFISLYRSPIVIVSNPFVYFVLVAASTVALSVPLHLGVKKIYDICRK